MKSSPAHLLAVAISATAALVPPPYACDPSLPGGGDGCPAFAASTALRPLPAGAPNATTLAVMTTAASPTAMAPVAAASSTTTEVVDTLVTYCPAPTTLVTNGNTYTVAAATTLTITDCPCTVTRALPAPPLLATAAPSSGGSMIAPNANASVPASPYYSATGAPSAASPMLPSSSPAPFINAGVAVQSLATEALLGGLIVGFLLRI